MSDKATREQLHAAIQESIHDDPTAKEKELDGSVLVGWVVIAEWAAPDGGTGITFRSGSATGPNPTWRSYGLMHYATRHMEDGIEEEENG